MAERRDRRDNRVKEQDNSIKKTICVNRVTKVVKGGRNMRFSALMVYGDGNGIVGIGMGRAREVSEAIEKATLDAKKQAVAVSRDGTTIPHQIVGKFGRGQVLLMPAAPGTGVIAGGPVRAVLEAAGIKDIRTKSLGSNNPINCAKATWEGLKELRTREQIAALRGIAVEDLN